MTKIIDFPNGNITLKGNDDDIADATAWYQKKVSSYTLAFELSEETKAEIAAGKPLFISLLYCKQFPPICVGSEDEVRSVLVDYGPLWKKEETKPNSVADIGPFSFTDALIASTIGKKKAVYRPGLPDIAYYIDEDAQVQQYYKHVTGQWRITASWPDCMPNFIDVTTNDWQLIDIDG